MEISVCTLLCHPNIFNVYFCIYSPVGLHVINMYLQNTLLY